ncbi:MAG: AMP-binding protein, partial [Acidobacteria bacterium]|nr:AMP-binding protein [Acidobacteriota bacterium]
ALMLPTGEEIFFAFFGILLAGGVPVPIYPPFKASRIEEYAQRQSRILQNAEARFLITFRQAEKLARLLKPNIPSLKRVLTVAELSRRESEPPRPRDMPSPLRGARLSGSSVALIQYTSGSTGDPKGVVLTHSNLLANIRAIGAGLKLQPADFGVSWLPLYHDMGLIGTWLTALCSGVPVAILSPLSFLNRPERWLWAIHQHRATVSAAPNFAYELCARRIDDRSIEGLDLSCWRAALNGAEPISPETLDRFAHRFAPYGFRAEAFLPVYGLAESSVALTFPPLARKPRVDCVQRERFEKKGEAQSCSEAGCLPLRFVSEGRALPGHEVRVVDEVCRPVDERVQGHIQFRGPSTMQGYFKNSEATAAVMRQGWAATGDLGYLADGELFVTARVKDVIIKGGRNLYPQEVEEIVSEVGGVRRGCVAAFGVHDERAGTERLVVVAETRQTDRAVRDQIAAQITARVDSHLGLPPDVVRLVAPQTVPKTSSGKIRRDACKQMYLQEQLATKPLPAWIQILRLGLGSVRGRARQGARRCLQRTYGLYALLVLTLVMLPGWLLVCLLPARGSERRAATLLRFLSRLTLQLAGLKPVVEGQQHLEEAVRQVKEEGRAFLLVSNHASYLDTLLVAAVSPLSACFVAKREAAAWPVIGSFIRKGGFLTVNREDALRAAADSEGICAKLRSGTSVHVFPEGTFTPCNGLRPFQMGAFKSAVETGCSILPLTLCGSRNVLRDGDWLPRPAAVRVVASRALKPCADDWREMVRLRDAVRSEILKHCGEGAFDAVLAGMPKPGLSNPGAPDAGHL